ncbi:pilus assembly protein TadG-related protein [Herbaspirillum sp.]|uniref:pilus assembly protein TadG-related protein n=1 Tax=Herbaspirillum sp. TaxID=1890675 RepID=UPI001B0A090A|nr:pilus assembly protein TadG-related protein [Herbaspirillum sp.]MBO9537643.1 pilus assembly protein TadE [Herbaspirillum sp.]
MLHTSSHRQEGAMIITVAFWFIALIAFAALAFDVGHLLVVRNELQNAADAAALAGANCLDKTPAASGSDCTSANSTTLHWAVAAAKASSSIGMNSSDSVALANGTVQTGYWNINGGSSLQPTTLSPLGPCTIVGGVMTTACDKPAVMVTLNKAAGSNGGPVGTLIAAMFSGVGISLTANAVAVISSPGQVSAGALIPYAVNKCLYDLYWDSTTNLPKTATATTLNGVPQVIGQPWELRIGSSYHYPNCDSGQWTSFQQNVNSDSAIKGLIVNGNSAPLAIGDNTWIQTGTKASSFNDLSAQYPTPPGADVTVPVVDQPAGWVTNTQAPIVAFGAFHIDDIQGGSGKYVQGHFIPITTSGGSSGGGPNFGSYTPPRLAH